MTGAFFCAWIAGETGSFWLGLGGGFLAAAAAGALVEILVIRRLYARDHLDQVLATFALILIFSELARWIFGDRPLYLDVRSEEHTSELQSLMRISYAVFCLKKKKKKTKVPMNATDAKIR